MPEPELDRRKNKEKGFLTHLVETFNGRQGRKVAFGIWVFIAANAFKQSHADMPWDLWWKCVLLSGALIGFGTILDSIVAKFGDAIAAIAGERVANMLGKKGDNNAKPNSEVPQA